MPFQKGQSGNIYGRSKKSWIKDRERMVEARKTWQRLLQIRDDLVLERKTVQGPDGPMEIDVISSVKDMINCCKEILNRAVGLPRQSVEISGDQDRPVLTKTEFNFDEYHKLFAQLGRDAGASNNGHGVEQPVYPAYTNGKAGGIS